VLEEPNHERVVRKKNGAIGFACPELVPPALLVPSANEGSEAEGSRVEGRSRRKPTELSRSIAREQVKRRKKKWSERGEEFIPSEVEGNPPPQP
jgi:hypothetical protein